MKLSKFRSEPIDEEERALMDAIENGETHPIPRDELAKIRCEIAASSAKNITIRVQNSDIAGYKEKSRLAGIPYQTLMNSVLHRYLTGELVPRTSL